MLHKYTGDIRPESQSALYPLIIVSRGDGFDVIHASGALQAAGLSSYDAAVSFATRIKVPKIDRVQILDTRNHHIPKWTYPLVTKEDYDRLTDWQGRCLAHGHNIVDIVEPTTGNSQRI